MPDYLYGKLPEQEVFVIGEGLAWSHHDALSGMYSKRVEVLHVADRYAVVETVSDNLIFYFFPAFKGFFHQHLRGECKGFCGKFPQFRVVAAEAAAQSS